MPYETLTPSRFKMLKPEFSGVDDSMVHVFITMASRFVDNSWTSGDYETAWAAMTCHLMTLEGLGTSTDAEIRRTGGSKVSSIKSGTLSLTFAGSDGASPEIGSLDWFNSTPCGSFYYLLLKMNRGGPRLLTSGALQALSLFPGMTPGNEVSPPAESGEIPLESENW